MAEEILAPLSGAVWKVQVEVGQRVEEDDEVIILEAMKMETAVFAPCSGIIREIKVKQGDKVDEDDILAMIED